MLPRSFVHIRPLVEALWHQPTTASKPIYSLVLFGCPFGLLIPYDLNALWRYTIDHAGSRGGLMYLPTTLPELVVGAFFLVSLVPAAFAFMLAGSGMAVLQYWGVVAPWSVLLAFPTVPPSMSSIIVTLVMLMGQSWAYGWVLRSLLRLVLRAVT